MAYPSGTVIRKEISDPDNFSQARDRYLSLPDDEKNRLADAIGWELSQANRQIQTRQLDLFSKVCPDLANRVSREVYLFETGRKI